MSSRNHAKTMERQLICYYARERKSVKVPQISIAYKLEMLHFQSKNAAVIRFTEDMTGNQEEEKILIKL